MRLFFYRLAADQDGGILGKPFKILLLVLSSVYAAAARSISFAYQHGLLQRRRLDKPVLSIGNITWGGAGKTPLVELVAEYFKERGRKPVILTRGYMYQKTGGVSDEAESLKEALPDVPVKIGRDRLAAGRQALKEGEVDIFILDDGFQHWRLGRDFDIVVIDSTNPFGNGHLIPRGILREPLSALKRAGLFVLTKTDAGRPSIPFLTAKIRRFNPDAPIVEAVHEPVALLNLTDKVEGSGREPSFLQNKKIGAFCSIADSASFRRTLENLGAEPVVFMPFLDHHIYSSIDVDAILRRCRSENVCLFVTTQKDAVKLAPFFSFFRKEGVLFSLKIKIRLTKGKDEFFHRISHLYQC